MTGSGLVRRQLSDGLAHSLNRVGVLPVARRIRRSIRLATDSGFRVREQAAWSRLEDFRRRHKAALGLSLTNGSGTQPSRRVLVVGFGPWVETQLGLVKALQLAGFDPTVVCVNIHDSDLVRAYYKVGGIDQVFTWDAFFGTHDYRKAKALLAPCRTMDDLVKIEENGIRIGRFAASTAIRMHRLRSLNLQAEEDRRLTTAYLARSLASARAAERILERFKPDLLLFLDGVYSPEGELLDLCLKRGIDALEWYIGHRPNALMLKRYSLANLYEHPWSLSPKSWDRVLTMPWTQAHHERIEAELYGSYVSGQWYSYAGTQLKKRMVDAATVRQEIGLDPAKKTVVIFPHILWDASFFHGKDVFRNYEEWFVESVRAACANTNVNWVVKIHPAHVGKSALDGYRGEPAEVITLRHFIGKLPPHVYFIPNDSPISTYSLFQVADAVLTVRGTVGIEAARLGVPVITAGTGRYSGKGFTIDAATREEYLELLSRIQDVPRLTAKQQELADRFAFGTYILRPLTLTTFTAERDPHKLRQTDIGRSHVQFHVQTAEDWKKAKDLRAFAEWAGRSRDSDYLEPTDQTP